MIFPEIVFMSFFYFKLNPPEIKSDLWCVICPRRKPSIISFYSGYAVNEIKIKGFPNLFTLEKLSCTFFAPYRAHLYN